MVAGNAIAAAVLGAIISTGFYAFVFAMTTFSITKPYSSSLTRYFLGHPVAIAATVLFCFALAILLSKWFALLAENSNLMRIRDHNLLPAGGDAGGPAERWRGEHDAGHVAANWLGSLVQLPESTRNSHLVSRLHEVLTRQSQRGSTRNLADDLRELSARDADAAHDSLGLVRIIVWAIPMLGFLGTVIGITQTLGGLDFSSGTAAVDNLKSGLYVAFDTTAIGLVLSVLAIFLQFPVERREQRLLAEIDARIGHLVSSTLPSDEASENQTVLIADLCRGVQAAVAESLDRQAKLWHDTISTAQQQWQSVHDQNNNAIIEAFELTLAPALLQHANSLRESSEIAGQQLSVQCDRWQESLNQAQQVFDQTNQLGTEVVVNGIETALRPALLHHSQSLEESALNATDRLRHQTQAWQSTIEQACRQLAAQQTSLLEHYDEVTKTNRNLQQLEQTNKAIEQSVSAAAGDGMADAMRTLARAVDVLSKRMASEPAQSQPARRAA